MTVCVLDYGSGNVGSVTNLLEAMGVPLVVSNATADVDEASHLVLPGVGAFGAAMERIRERIPVEHVQRVVAAGKPFLGICVGMQVLATEGEEFGVHAGLGWIPGRVRRLEVADLPLPHIGWNAVHVERAQGIVADFPQDADFYFVHSYAFQAEDPAAVLATTTYGSAFPSIVGKENVWGVQFHPEKSQKAGRLLFERFLAT